MACVPCEDCIRPGHHWLIDHRQHKQSQPPFTYTCKHCSVRAVTCPICEGDDEDCLICDGYGVIALTAIA